MKIGVVGAGHWGRNIIRTLHEMGCLAAVADPDSDALKSNTPPGIPSWQSPQEMFRDGGLDAVCIATPVPTHFDLGKQALEAGLDVFIEKPITHNLAEAQQLHELSTSTHRILMTGHQLLFHPATVKMAEELRAGRIGDLWLIHQERMKLGRVRANENVLWSFGVHDIAVALSLVEEDPSELFATGGAWVQDDIEDDVHLHMRFPSGVKSHLHVSWMWPHMRRSTTLIGSKGALVFDELAGRLTHHRFQIDERLNAASEDAQVLYEGVSEPLKAEMEHFISCLKNRTPPICSGDHAVDVIRILEHAGQELAHR